MEITEAEYRKNPLAADVKYWGHWILEQSRREIGHFYPPEGDSRIPVAYLWARTVTCPNPACGATIPLVKQLWLCNKRKRQVAMRMVPDATTKRCCFEVVHGKDIGFDPKKGTMLRGSAACPFCHQAVTATHIRQQCQGGRMGHQMMAVVLSPPGRSGKVYRSASDVDTQTYDKADTELNQAIRREGEGIVPAESIPCYDPRRVSPPLYGLNHFRDLFNQRQLLCLTRYAKWLKDCVRRVQSIHDTDYARAVNAVLALVIDWVADKQSTLTRWHTSDREKISGTFSRQALGMVWDYAETNTLCESSGGFLASLVWTSRVLKSLNAIPRSATVSRGSANQLPIEDGQLDAVVTDPPYYDAIPYSVLSDFFYVWLKRTASPTFPDAFITPLTPKANEAIEQRRHSLLKQRKDKTFYENMMFEAFAEMRRVLHRDGVCCVMFAHKSTAAWESLIAGLLRAGLVVTSSWPLHTEMKTRMVARETAALASSVTLVCRKRATDAGDGLWDDVRNELQRAILGHKEVDRIHQGHLDFFWSQGIRGADFFISAIGPALSVFGRYSRVTRLSGEEVTVGQFLDEVRGLVTNYALGKILQAKHTGTIDPETRFYVIWKWSYADAKVPADEAFKLAQGIGFDTESMWGRTGVLVKSGENVQAVPVEKRMKLRGLGEPAADNTPASLIDVLHRLCAFREAGDTQGMGEFLARSGHERNASLWVVAQAVSEILPDGDKEKQLMQGLLNQREQVEAMARDKKLF